MELLVWGGVGLRLLLGEGGIGDFGLETGVGLDRWLGLLERRFGLGRISFRLDWLGGLEILRLEWLLGWAHVWWGHIHVGVYGRWVVEDWLHFEIEDVEVGRCEEGEGNDEGEL